MPTIKNLLHITKLKNIKSGSTQVVRVNRNKTSQTRNAFSVIMSSFLMVPSRCTYYQEFRGQHDVLPGVCDLPTPKIWRFSTLVQIGVGVEVRKLM